MRTLRSWLLAAALPVITLAPSPAGAQSIEIIGQVGVTLASYSGEGITSGTEVAGSAGAKLRVGRVLYIDGGIFWTESGGEIDGDPITLSSIRFPATLGLRILRATILDLRVYGGAVYNSVSSVSSNSSGIADDDVKSSVWAGRAGAGVDVAIIAIDLGYEFGLTDVFEESAGPDLQGVKQSGWVLEAGLRFAF